MKSRGGVDKFKMAHFKNINLLNVSFLVYHLISRYIFHARTVFQPKCIVVV